MENIETVTPEQADTQAQVALGQQIRADLNTTII